MTAKEPLVVAFVFCAFSALAVAPGCQHAAPVESAPTPPGCPASWLQVPTVDPAITPPPASGGVVLHATASGTQNYACLRVSADPGSPYVWKFTGPEAALADCHGSSVGRHFASEAGATAPEWQVSDGSSVVAHKVAASSPDGGAPSVPWLLLAADHAAGPGLLGAVTYIQRVGTNGGVAPTTGCDASHTGLTQKVPYTADYYFYAPPHAP